MIIFVFQKPQLAQAQPSTSMTDSSITPKDAIFPPENVEAVHVQPVLIKRRRISHEDLG
jgi:hypothetical protein